MTFQDDLKNMDLEGALEKHDLSLKEAFENAIIVSKPIKEALPCPPANYCVENNCIVRYSDYDKQIIAKCESVEDANNKISYLKTAIEDKTFTNVYRRKNSFEIRKSVQGRDIYYGSYHYCEQAILIAEELKKVNWDKSQLDKIRLKLGINRTSLRGRPPSKNKAEKKKYYIRTDSGKFRIIKTVNGKTRYFGTYELEEDAKRMVEALKKYDWDKSKLECIRDNMGV